ncbi:DNA cytosine methyltransferase [Priestia abyssalis]|uniref:DNA cytosine methyltransferase n=1 Tax=Priestia abyssalis TaxID=1221450 RepID=UPI000995D234|nr:DNA cytosine methyltransferase [Priestia abyssalis]
MKVADFFCGAGGFSEGFRLAGFDVVFGVDKWKPAVITHEKNHPDGEVYYGDVEELSNLSDEEFHSIIPDTEIIIGSPPCVAFSNSNRSGKGDKSLGIRLMESYLRIVARKKFKENSILKYWILENVPNLQNYIKDEYTAEELGLKGDFTLKVRNENSKEYNSKYYGVAQNRKRFFCGEFPTPQEIISSDEKVIPLKFILESLGHPKEEKEGNRTITDPNYQDLEMSLFSITDHHYIKEIAQFEWEKAERAKTDKGYMGKMSFPEDLNKPSRTIMATLSSSARESLIYQYKNHNNRFRSPTIREVASIMSFPLDYRFYGDSMPVKYKLVGNAVPPKLSFAFARAIAEKEGFPIPEGYPKLTLRFEEDKEFKELNFSKLPMNIEKRKKMDKARYKYHIPYLKVNTFRVELTNHHSDFKKGEFVWDVEIHKSQGVQNKKVFQPKNVDAFPLGSVWEEKVGMFLKTIERQLVPSLELQKIYCMTQKERDAQGLMGPDEILMRVRNFIDSILREDNNLNEQNIKIEEEPNELPFSIALGYYVLTKIMNKVLSMENIENLSDEGILTEGLFIYR